jgi:hypothetical protein
MKPFLVILWLSLVVAGFTMLAHYQWKPGGKGAAPAVWPERVSIAPTPGKFNLVLSLHPHCPCSAATIEELNRILAHTAQALRVHILLYSPADADKAWSHTSLVATAEQFPNTSVAVDTDGQQAARFGAKTSGDVQLYAPDGKLLFHGGITDSRGHAGDNAGAEAIVSLVNGGKPNVNQTPVYGCGICKDRDAEATP